MGRFDLTIDRKLRDPLHGSAGTKRSGLGCCSRRPSEVMAECATRYRRHRVGILPRRCETRPVRDDAIPTLAITPFWAALNEQLIDLVDILSDETLDWRPTPEVWSCRELFLHIAGARHALVDDRDWRRGGYSGSRRHRRDPCAGETPFGRLLEENGEIPARSGDAGCLLPTTARRPRLLGRPGRLHGSLHRVSPLGPRRASPRRHPPSTGCSRP